MIINRLRFSGFDWCQNGVDNVNADIDYLISDVFPSVISLFLFVIF